MASPTISSSLAGAPNISGLQIIVRQETPFLPKVAFVLISLASLAGASLTGFLSGMDGVAIVARWWSMWAVALAGGFAVWRVFYLRAAERDAHPAEVTALNTTTLARAKIVGRYVAPIVALGAVGLVVTPYLSGGLMWSGVAVMLALAASLMVGIDSRAASFVAVALSLVAVLGWAYADAGLQWPGWVRAAHLAAFTLWLGGALWNITVAMPAGREHPNVDAVVAGANQLDRFRWVVRFALPTIIITGLIMASGFWGLPASWWLAFPGVLIPLKVLSIVALVVVFITCPLFRHCSPVQGVCDLDDLSEDAHDRS